MIKKIIIKSQTRNINLYVVIYEFRGFD